MVKRQLILWLVMINLSIAGCGGENKSEKKNTTTSKTQSENNSGALVYKKFCASCHQTDGNGVPGMYPPIAGTKMVNGDKEELIRIILNGMSGEIKVKGEIYNNVMPAHSHLSDQQIADLLTYIRSNFENDAEKITADEVAKVRKMQ